MNNIKKIDSSEQNLTRNTVIIAIFGALWGLMEITLGTTLKGLRIPMGGAVLTAISSVIFLTGRYFVRKRGSILLMGAVAAILKIFSVGTVIAGPFLAILIEATLAELLISILGINRFSYIFTPSILLIYTIIHPFISHGILFGTEIYKVYLDTFEKAAQILHIDIKFVGWLILTYVVIHLILGFSAGLLAFVLSQKVEKEFFHTQGMNL
jgi:hypothetical protein